METRRKTKCRTVVETLGDEIIAGRYRPQTETSPNARHANANGRFFQRAIVLSARYRKDGKTRVTLDLPIGGSAFVVFAPESDGKDSRVEHVERVEVNITNAWRVSFAYHRGVSAAAPEPVVMETLRDWTSFGEDGKAESTSLRYFSGTAIYKTTVAVAAGSFGEGRMSFPILQDS